MFLELFNFTMEAASLFRSLSCLFYISCKGVLNEANMEYSFPEITSFSSIAREMYSIGICASSANKDKDFNRLTACAHLPQYRICRLLSKISSFSKSPLWPLPIQDQHVNDNPKESMGVW